jgi:FMN-dependent NADH-azoreductase
MKLLHIDASILGESSGSRAVSAAVVAQWQTAVPGLQITYRDLAERPLPHLSSVSLARTDVTEAAQDARVLAEFQEADVLVIGAPMYNFTIPSQLKAWIDRILVSGKTFRYTAAGPQGLAGGIYPEGAPGEHVESYLKFIFTFVGITDVTFLRADGLAISPEARDKGLRAALVAIPLPLARAA